MRTVYLRNVPDDIAEKLEQLAARERASLNTFVLRELAEIARRADNADLLHDLPDLSIQPTGLAASTSAERDER